MENLKKEYENFGFFKLENVFDKIFIKKLLMRSIRAKNQRALKFLTKKTKELFVMTWMFTTTKKEV